MAAASPAPSPAPSYPSPPVGTPAFLVAGHAQVQQGLYGHYKPTTGHQRKRRLYTTSFTIVNVSARFNQAQMTAYDDWAETTLGAYNALWLATIANLGPGNQSVPARWVAPYEIEERSALFYLSGQLLIGDTSEFDGGGLVDADLLTTEAYDPITTELGESLEIE